MWHVLLCCCDTITRRRVRTPVYNNNDNNNIISYEVRNSFAEIKRVRGLGVCDKTYRLQRSLFLFFNRIRVLFSKRRPPHRGSRNSLSKSNRIILCTVVDTRSSSGPRQCLLFLYRLFFFFISSPNKQFCARKFISIYITHVIFIRRIK